MTARSGLVDDQCPTTDSTPVDFGDHDGRVFGRDLYKTEATHLTRIEVSNKIHGFNSAVLGEYRANFVFGRVKR